MRLSILLIVAPLLLITSATHSGVQTRARGLRLVPHRISLANGKSFDLNLPEGFAISVAAQGLRRVRSIINRREGWVEINHEAIEGLMPAMQMEWSVKDRSLLRNVRVGDKVEFVVVETGKGEIIAEMKRVKTPG
jgi:Cu/Ag efflux protein CusF